MQGGEGDTRGVATPPAVTPPRARTGGAGNAAAGPRSPRIHAWHPRGEGDTRGTGAGKGGPARGWHRGPPTHVFSLWLYLGKPSPPRDPAHTRGASRGTPLGPRRLRVPCSAVIQAGFCRSRGAAGAAGALRARRALRAPENAEWIARSSLPLSPTPARKFPANSCRSNRVQAVLAWGSPGCQGARPRRRLC